MSEAGDIRVEHDLLGDRDVPANAYYGVHTLRALENFPISGIAIRQYPALARALALIKLAAVILANEEHLRESVERSIGIVTALNPYIGYASARRLHDRHWRLAKTSTTSFWRGGCSRRRTWTASSPRST